MAGQGIAVVVAVPGLVVGVDCVTDHVEGHDLVGVVVVAVVGVGVVEQLDPRAGLDLAEVDDDLVPLGAGVPHAADRYASRHHPPVGGDDLQRHAVAEPPLVGAGDRAVEETEAVGAPFHRHGRPRPAVDQDDVAPQPRVGVVVVAQGAVGVEHRVVDHQGDVELALGQVLPLDRVVQHVERGEPAVGLLGGEVDPVVVIPQRPGRLVVGVEVVLVVVDRRDIVGVAVIFGQ